MTRPGRSRHRVLALAATFSFIAAAFAGVPATAQPPASTAAAATDDGVEIHVDQITPQVMTAGQDLTVRAVITNTTSRAVQGTTTLSLSAYRLGTRGAVDAWLDGRTTGLTTLARTALDAPLQPGASTTVELVAPAASFALSNIWGPRGLQIAFDGGTTASRAHLQTFLLWLTTEDIPQADVALVAAVTGPGSRPDLAFTDTPSTPEPTATSAPTVVVPGRLDDLIETARSVPELGLAIDPALLAADAPRADELDQLVTDGRESIALPWSDPDLSAVERAGTVQLLTAALHLSAQRRPDLADGLAWAADDADQGTADLVAAAGGTRLIVPSSSSPTVSTAQTDSGAITVLAADPQLSDLLDGSSGLSPAEAQQMALALLAVSARSDDTQVLVAAGRDWDPDATQTSAFVAALRQAPWVRLTSTTGLVSSDQPTTFGTTQTPPSAIDAGSVQALAQARIDLSQFAMISEEPTVVTEGVDQAVLVPLSYAWRDDPLGRARALSQVMGGIAERREAVLLTPRTDLTVINTTSEVLVNVRNTLPVPVTVRVRLDPTKPCLTTTLSEPVTIPAGTDSQVPVTLGAHAHCRVTIRAWLVSDDGAPVTTEPLEFHALVSPSLESVGTGIVGGVLALVLVVGVVRTIRRGRRTSRVLSDDEDTTADEPPADLIGTTDDLAGTGQA